MFARSDLAKARRGPCVVEEYDATSVVPPDAEAVLDNFGNIIIDLAKPSDLVVEPVMPHSVPNPL